MKIGNNLIVTKLIMLIKLSEKCCLRCAQMTWPHAVSLEIRFLKTRFVEEGRRSTQITFVYESQTVHVPNVCFQYSNDCRRYTHDSTSQHDKQFDTHPSTQTNFKLPPNTTPGQPITFVEPLAREFCISNTMKTETRMCSMDWDARYTWLDKLNKWSLQCQIH